ncbi:hypothetical protein MOQ72_39055 [Saccharopolyspora sp. K220]|uniref:hypothetical protein n=1 Tax=Saccharopolyspora soli TaxID=2926618 RepID=UPI001F57C351|nr:hypothetical protein [Saccharopolyspora soli]MCI2423429.1 hypothetical protein [Saccharopolyspora soli]
MTMSKIAGVTATAILAIGLAASPASATAKTGPDTRYNGEPICVAGAACFYEGFNAPYLNFFQGRTAWYAKLTDECTTLPFGAWGLFNLSETVLVYSTTNCSGTPMVTAPDNNWYSWQNRQAAYSFRPAN